MIVYFSGTGNSYYVAKSLLKEGEELVDAMTAGKAVLRGGRLGVVYPCYCGDMPPALIAFAAQFTAMDGFDLGTMTWNNFASFGTVLSDPLFWKSFGIDLFFVASQFASLLVALLTAAILAQLPKAGKIFTVLFFVPQICSSVAIILMWQNMFDTNFGIINAVLTGIFGEGARVNWLNEQGSFLAVMFFVTVWQGPGYGILMYKAAFTNVNESLYEAARLDGANRFQQFLHITFPAISPTVSSPCSASNATRL